MTPAQTIAGFIKMWEGGLSLDKSDTGNWVSGVLVGSKYGVTAPALAAHRGVPVSNITSAIMAALTIEEAAAIGLQSYYLAPHLDRLAWNRVTASVLDFGWGAGPGRAVRKLQSLIGATADGLIGPKTAKAYNDFLISNGEPDAATAWGAVRNVYYDSIVANNPTQARFLNGWKNRTAGFLPGSLWWNQWKEAA